MDKNNLTLDEKIGQKFIFGVNSYNSEFILKLIKENYIGGVILYRKNYKNYKEMISLIKKIKLANKDNKIPLFIAIDQENGIVNRMPDEIKPIYNIYRMTKYGNNVVKEYASITSKMLSDIGINMNLAPIMDIYNNSRALYKRCFFGSVDDIVKYGKIYTDEFKKNNVISVIKHFPGLGVTKHDTHFFVPYIFNYKKVMKEHIVPFKSMFEYGIDAVMVGHINIRRLTNGLPASISRKFIKRHLRSRFDGIIITDEITMINRTIFYKFILYKKLFKTDNDIFLIKVNNYEQAYKIIKKYENNYNMKNLNNSVDRILSVKEKYNINDNIDFDGLDIKVLNKKIKTLNKKVDKK